jgi:hypothetical protein
LSRSRLPDADANADPNDYPDSDQYAHADPNGHANLDADRDADSSFGSLILHRRGC